MFLIGAVGDLFWTRWAINSADRNRWRAAHWGALIPVIGAAAVLLYKDQPVFIIPYAVGCWVGTFYSIRE
jgi:hypothetical protein